jgi:hypothetical protein
MYNISKLQIIKTCPLAQKGCFTQKLRVKHPFFWRALPARTSNLHDTKQIVRP